MDKLPYELFTDILLQIDDINSLANFCKSNHMAMQLCKLYRVQLCKSFVERYHVDFNDPHNFIYIANDANKADVFNNDEPDYCKIFRLYSKFYDHKEIKLNKYARITSMPLYPNVQKLDCSFNNLKTLPDGMKNLEELKCSETHLKALPKGMIRLKKLECNGNELKELPNDMVTLKELNCYNNKVEKLPEGMIN